MNTSPMTRIPCSICKFFKPIVNKTHWLCQRCNEERLHGKKDIQAVFKKESVSGLVNSLDEVFSKYVRQSAADENGIVKCFTCGAYHPIKKMQCGHYVSRSNYALRFEEKNTAPQCYRCNIKMEGNKPSFAQRLVEKYGQGILEELEMRKNNRFKLEPFILKEMIKSYTEKLNQLKKGRAA